MIPLSATGVDVKQVAKLLGGERLIGGRVRSLAELGRAVERGLPKASLIAVVRAIYADPRRRRDLLHAVVPEATFKRRRERLSPAESEKTERLARVTAQAIQVWGEAEAAREFLTSPHPLLDGRKPIDAATTDLGARQVEAILVSIEHGLPV